MNKYLPLSTHCTYFHSCCKKEFSIFFHDTKVWGVVEVSQSHIMDNSNESTKHLLLFSVFTVAGPFTFSGDIYVLKNKTQQNSMLKTLLRWCMVYNWFAPQKSKLNRYI